MQVRDIYSLLNKLAGLPDNTPLLLFEEVKWEPTVMVEQLQPLLSLGAQAELENGDIICFQKAVPDNAVGTAAASSAGSESMKYEVSGAVAAAGPDGMEVEVDQQQQQQLGVGVVQQQAAVQQQAQRGQQQGQQGGQQVMQCRYLRVPEFLSYIRNRRLVSCRVSQFHCQHALHVDVCGTFVFVVRAFISCNCFLASVLSLSGIVGSIIVLHYSTPTKLASAV